MKIAIKENQLKDLYQAALNLWPEVIVIDLENKEIKTVARVNKPWLQGDFVIIDKEGFDLYWEVYTEDERFENRVKDTYNEEKENLAINYKDLVNEYLEDVYGKDWKNDEEALRDLFEWWVSGDFTMREWLTDEVNLRMCDLQRKEYGEVEIVLEE